MINIKKSLLGCLLVSAAVSTAIILPAGSKAEAASAITQKNVQSQTGIIQASVRLRDKPSMSSQVMGYLKSGEQVTILEKSTSYFYKVKTLSGQVGYTSSADQYIVVKSGSGSGSGSSAGSGSTTKPDNGSGSPAPVVPPTSSNVSATIEQVIQTGMKYLGTPYEYGSDRNQTNTFDCSAFTRQIFKEAAGIVLPADSRQQGTWVKQNSSAVYNVDKLKRGDLVFFMTYKGSKASDYDGVNVNEERITHAAVYLGDGKLLHTYSEKAGGVVVTDFSSSWKLRFLYGGSVIK
ncbi:C40 family peptidase [Paenibacillus dokdonensis]|uniref:C40 family peptidase n=1 Tax=Paenibacillus dokdonensis TaxID=2567944 RepID=A0ABU6GWG3_9BACL|nr:C40 family peptidase [Paenibacillus dokdonensis]MEC0243733.1 C40 family peptidase [Paenibacillus dokdonensis]